MNCCESMRQKSGASTISSRPKWASFSATPSVRFRIPILTAGGPPRPGCDHSGRRMVGCRTGGKNSLDRNYLYLAETSGAKIIPQTLVTAVQENPSDGYEIRSQKSTGSLNTKNAKMDRQRRHLFSRSTGDEQAVVGMQKAENASQVVRSGRESGPYQ